MLKELGRCRYSKVFEILDESATKPLSSFFKYNKSMKYFNPINEKSLVLAIYPYMIHSLVHLVSKVTKKVY